MTSRPRNSIAIANAIPDAWLGNLAAGTQLAIGGDVATTTKEKSNPSAIAVTEKLGLDFYVRLLVRWKTDDPEIYKAVVGRVLDQLQRSGRKARRASFDASNEKFFAANLRAAFAGRVPVELVVSGEAMNYRGEDMNYKIYLGNLYVNTIDDGRLALPDCDWVAQDARLVKRDRGTFITEVANDGSHGDGFDAVKLSLHGLVTKGGPAEASAAQVGDFGTKTLRPGIKNPYAHLHERKGGLYV